MHRRKMRRPGDLVFSLYGEYLLARPEPVWVGSLIDLLGRLGLSENATRTALSRMARRGWLSAERHGRRSHYGLTARGRRLLEEGARRIHQPPLDRPWDGAWHLVAYSVPEEQREARDRLRHRLLWLGFGSLGGGLWISPHDQRAAVEDVARELGVTEHVELFRAEHRGFSDATRLVARCWDLRAIHRRYAAFARAWEPRFRDALAASAEGALEPQNAFVQRFGLIHEYRDFLRIDPHLPRALLPHDWAGGRAAHLFESFRDLLTEPADDFVEQVLAAPLEPVPA